MLRLRCFCAVILLALLVGCGSGNVPLKGTVTFSDDGSPVPVGVVSFLKDGKIARGTIGRDGTYIVGFEGLDDGLPPGRYVILVFAEESIEDPPGSGNFSSVPLIDPKYANPATSELSLEVTSSTKVHDIQVERFRK